MQGILKRCIAAIKIKGVDVFCRGGRCCCFWQIRGTVVVVAAAAGTQCVKQTIELSLSDKRNEIPTFVVVAAVGGGG